MATRHRVFALLVRRGSNSYVTRKPLNRRSIVLQCDGIANALRERQARELKNCALPPTKYTPNPKIIGVVAYFFLLLKEIS